MRRREDVGLARIAFEVYLLRMVVFRSPFFGDPKARIDLRPEDFYFDSGVEKAKEEVRKARAEWRRREAMTAEERIQEDAAKLDLVKVAWFARLGLAGRPE